jgi:hypothetical protein
VWQGPICQAEHIIIMSTHSFRHKLSVACVFLFNFVMLLKWRSSLRICSQIWQ